MNVKMYIMWDYTTVLLNNSKFELVWTYVHALKQCRIDEDTEKLLYYFRQV